MSRSWAPSKAMMTISRGDMRSPGRKRGNYVISAKTRHRQNVALRMARRSPMTIASPFRIGFLLFPRLTQLDLTGPYEILSRMPGAEMHLVAKTLEPVAAEKGLRLLPTTTLGACPPL